MDEILRVGSLWFGWFGQSYTKMMNLKDLDGSSSLLYMICIFCSGFLFFLFKGW